eukprot:4821658-Prymnesium_polylepis.1
MLCFCIAVLSHCSALGMPCSRGAAWGNAIPIVRVPTATGLNAITQSYSHAAMQPCNHAIMPSCVCPRPQACTRSRNHTTVHSSCNHAIVRVPTATGLNAITAAINKLGALNNAEYFWIQEQDPPCSEEAIAALKFACKARAAAAAAAAAIIAIRA